MARTDTRTAQRWFFPYRVKNNLAVIEGLVNIQRDYVNAPEAAGLNTLAGRVRAIGWMHKLLYQESIKDIDASQAVREIFEAVTDTVIPAEMFVDFVQHTKPTVVSIDEVVPFALIVNEAIVNAIKYAFKGREFGTITVDIAAGAGRSLSRLSIADDGNGGYAAETGTGSLLLPHLAEQLNCDYSLCSDDRGTRHTLTRKQAPTSRSAGFSAADMRYDPGMVFLVEDEAIISLSEQKQLQSAGFTVWTAKSNAEAIDALKQSVKEQKVPGAVIMDVKLFGEKDGIDTARKMQADFGYAGLIVFLSGFKLEETQKRIEALALPLWRFFNKNDPFTRVIAKLQERRAAVLNRYLFSCGCRSEPPKSAVPMNTVPAVLRKVRAGEVFNAYFAIYPKSITEWKGTWSTTKPLILQ